MKGAAEDRSWNRTLWLEIILPGCCYAVALGYPYTPPNLKGYNSIQRDEFHTERCGEVEKAYAVMEIKLGIYQQYEHTHGWVIQQT